MEVQIKRGDVVQIDPGNGWNGGHLACVDSVSKIRVSVALPDGSYTDVLIDRVARIGPAIWPGDLLDGRD